MLTVLIAAETMLLILVAVVVVALLRSHAEILRRLDERAARGGEGSLARAPSRGGELAAPDLTGWSLAGEAVQVGLPPGGPSTLIAFLSSGCRTCNRFWEAFAAPEAPALPRGGRIVIVTRDSTHESPSRLRELAPSGGEVPVVMSSDAWQRYAVPSSPYFVHVDGPSGEIAGEGSASSWEQVVSLLRDALDDGPGEGQSGTERIERIDADLARAGIEAGHPSLYPGSGRPLESEGRRP